MLSSTSEEIKYHCQRHQSMTNQRKSSSTHIIFISLFWILLFSKHSFDLLHLHAWSMLKEKSLFVILFSRIQTFAIPRTAEHQGFMSYTLSQSLLKLMSIELVIFNHLILWHLLLLLPSIFPSIRNFSNESTLHIRWSNYRSFSFSISPSNEYSGLISFRIDWFDLLAVQGTFKTLLQHHSLKASVLWHSAFFMVQLSYPYMTTGKTIALTTQTCVVKVMSLLFNILSRLVIAFLPGASVIYFMAAVTVRSDFGAQEMKFATVSTFPPSFSESLKTNISS